MVGCGLRMLSGLVLAYLGGRVIGGPKESEGRLKGDERLAASVRRTCVELERRGFDLSEYTENALDGLSPGLDPVLTG